MREQNDDILQSDELDWYTAEITHQFSADQSVWFDEESVQLIGCYQDELSAYRAKRIWRETLENSFLLEAGHDFHFKIRQHQSSSFFLLRCEFVTACARYAFWRLTNDQALEAQYVIETAHIPSGERWFEHLHSAGDLQEWATEPSILDAHGMSHLGRKRQKKAFSRVLGALEPIEKLLQELLSGKRPRRK